VVKIETIADDLKGMFGFAPSVNFWGAKGREGLQPMTTGCCLSLPVWGAVFSYGSQPSPALCWG